MHAVLASKGRCSVTGDLTVRILTEIRDGVRETNSRLDQTRGELSLRLDKTNSRIDTLTQRVVESEIHTATAITELAGTVRDVATLLREQGDLRPRAPPPRLTRLPRRGHLGRNEHHDAMSAQEGLTVAPPPRARNTSSWLRQRKGVSKGHA